MTTRYRARTAVERWQLQDRLRLRLQGIAPRHRPRFYETAAGELAFTLWTALRPGAAVIDGLRQIDRDEPGPLR